MSFSVILKPSGWLPVGTGRVEYTFNESSLGGKTNYRIRITLNGTSVPSADYYADENGDVVADIAPLLRSLCTMDPTGRFADPTYVEYQAIWEEGSDSPGSFSSDIIRAYAGVNDYNNYRSQVFISSSQGKLLHGSKIYAWKDRKTYIELLHDDSLPASVDIVFIPGNGDPETVLGNFDGSAFDFESFNYSAFTKGGTIVVRKNAAPFTIYASCDLVYMGEECQNVIYLNWINSYCGLSVWLFDQDQVLDLTPDELETPPRYRVSARGINIEQFRLMADLKKAGALISDNRKFGAYVVDAVDENNPVNVYVEPEISSTRTRNILNAIDLMLRYPSSDLIEI